MIAACERVDRFWADELGCMSAALYSEQITVCAPPHRAVPRWMGWMAPLECIVVDGAPAGVISVTADLESPLRALLASSVPAKAVLPPDGRALVPFARDHLPNGYPKVHRILHCPPDSFRPAPDVLPVEALDEDDIHAGWYRYHFDGPVFVARDRSDNIAAWAALKLKSADVWEMAVATEPQFRGQGLAKSLVSHATRAALDAGKVALYLHDITNHASAHVCGALGYQGYGYELVCETGRIPPR